MWWWSCPYCSIHAVAPVRRPGDAEPIKRLKREMSVALGEEDYATAARIRDHPYVQLYLSINEALRKKDIEVSSQCSAFQQMSRHEACAGCTVHPVGHARALCTATGAVEARRTPRVIQCELDEV